MRHFVAAAAAYVLAVQQANQRLKSLHPLPCGWVLSNRIAARSGLCSAKKQGNKSAGLFVRNPRRSLHHPICICLDLRGC